MDPVTFLNHVGSSVATSFLHNWPFLTLGILTAAALKVYVGTDRVASLMRRRTPVAVAGSVAAAVATPFCSCGTTAVPSASSRPSRGRPAPASRPSMAVRSASLASSIVVTRSSLRSCTKNRRTILLLRQR